MANKFRTCPFVLALAGVFVLAGCNKKVAKAATPPPPPPAAPTASLGAAPNVIRQGQSTTLTWQTTNANDITIQRLGTVAASGSRSVTPGTSTTYNLAAKGPGGTQDASARVTVSPLPVAKVVTPQPSEEDLFGSKVQDVFFNFDKYNIRTDEVPVTDNDSKFLEQHPDRQDSG